MSPKSLEIHPHAGANFPKGIALLKDSLQNKGTAFSDEERDALGLRGLLPPRIFPIEQQVERALRQFRKKESDLERYIFLTSLQQRNETLFFRLLLEGVLPVLRSANGGLKFADHLGDDGFEASGFRIKASVNHWGPVAGRNLFGIPH